MVRRKSMASRLQHSTMNLTSVPLLYVIPFSAKTPQGRRMDGSTKRIFNKGTNPKGIVLWIFL